MPLHLHVEAAHLQFLKHLGQAALAGLIAFGARNPTSAVVLLVRMALVVGVHQSPLLERFSDEGRHGVTFTPGWHGALEHILSCCVQYQSTEMTCPCPRR